MQHIEGVPLTRYWLIPQACGRRCIAPPEMSPDEIRQRTQRTWDEFYSFPPDLAAVERASIPCGPGSRSC